MNKFFKTCIILISCLSVINAYSGKLTRAINSLDAIAVENLLKEKSFSPDKKNKLFSLAKENVKKYETSAGGITKFSSKKNIILGGALTTAGSVLAVFIWKNFWPLINDSYFNRFPVLKKEESFENLREGALCTAVGIPMLLYGIKNLRDGLKALQSSSNLQKAQEIKDLIKNCPIKNPVNNDKQNKIAQEKS